MASVITIQGTGEGEHEIVACRTKDGKEYRIGECKKVKNKRTRCEYEICCVGKKRSPLTGWSFKEDSYNCPGRPRKVKHAR